MKNYTFPAEAFERYMDASVELFMEFYVETIPINTDDLPDECSPQLQDKCKALIRATNVAKIYWVSLKELNGFLRLLPRSP